MNQLYRCKSERNPIIIELSIPIIVKKSIYSEWKLKQVKPCQWAYEHYSGICPYVYSRDVLCFVLSFKWQKSKKRFRFISNLRLLVVFEKLGAAGSSIYKITLWLAYRHTTL